MTFEQLNYFIAVVESDTFFDAAYKMNISQSSLSKHIMKLEKELDLKLFDRSSRSATLTQAGEFFYNEAKQLVKHYQNTLKNVENFKTTHENKLHIAVLPIQTQYNLNELFNNFKRQNPNIDLQITEVEDDKLIEGIEKNHNINANIIKTARTESILGSVSINEGISLLPKSNFEVFHKKNINTISLDPSIKLSVVLAKHKSTKYNFSIKKFIDFVEDFKSEL